MPGKSRYCCGKTIEEDTNMIHCDVVKGKKNCPGRLWFHFECIDKTMEEINKIDNYICNSCTLRTGEKTTYKTAQPSVLSEINLANMNNTASTVTEPEENMPAPDETTDNETETNNENIDQELEVKAIKDWGICVVDKRSMKFLIEWVGYPEAKDHTWEFEKDLTKCYDLISEYRTRNKLGTTTLEPIGGAEEGGYNIKNWVHMEKIRVTAEQFLQHERYQTDLDLIVIHSSQFKLPTKDSIILLLHKNHYFALLILAKEEKILIADGNNLNTEKETWEELSRIIGKNLVSIRTEKQFKLDQCASAAILASLEFSRQYKQGDLIFPSLIFPNHLHQRVINILHPEKSKPAAGKKDIKGINRYLTCKHCGVYKTTKGRTTMATHERQCSMKITQ